MIPVLTNRDEVPVEEQVVVQRTTSQTVRGTALFAMNRIRLARGFEYALILGAAAHVEISDTFRSEVATSHHAREQHTAKREKKIRQGSTPFQHRSLPPLQQDNFMEATHASCKVQNCLPRAKSN